MTEGLATTLKGQPTRSARVHLTATGAACAALLLCMCCAGCSPSVRLGEEVGTYEKDVIRLQRRLLDAPGDAEALRDLGVIYLRTRRYTEAHNYLKKAYARTPGDAKTVFYFGVASELVGEQEAALQLYEQYAEVSRLSPYRRRLEGRYQWLLRKIARAEMQERVAESTGGADADADEAPSSRTVAVFPLAYQDTSQQYAPLGRGLSEMMTVDLAQVGRLRVVERIRLQALLDELELAQSQYVDPSTAPRVGRLLGAGRLVGGFYNVLPGEELRLDVVLTESDAPRPLPALESRTGALRRLFRLEKEAIFRVIDALGLQLTPEERRAIEEVPTENLQAFLAYSRGLAQEDAGQYAQAFASYQRAAELDPDFEAAAERAEAAAGLSAAAGAPGDVLEGTLANEAMGAASSINLLGRRARRLNEGIGSIFVPGPDARQPTVEAFGAPLADPPRPPSEGN